MVPQKISMKQKRAVMDEELNKKYIKHIKIANWQMKILYYH